MRGEVRLDPGCPWYSLSELRPPNVDWCETQQCAWIVEPANAWSNLAYVAVALVLWLLVRDARSAPVRFFAPAAAIVGLSSGIYHASYTFVLQILDFFGMYVFCGLLLSVNLWRAGWLGPGDWWRRFWQGVALATLVTVAVDFLELPIQALVFVAIVAIAVSELRLSRGTGTRLGAFAAAMALLGAGSVFSLLDVTRAWCWPDHPFLQGHAIWHVLSAAALLAAYLHYRQFDDELAAA